MNIRITKVNNETKNFVFENEDGSIILRYSFNKYKNQSTLTIMNCDEVQPNELENFKIDTLKLFNALTAVI